MAAIYNRAISHTRVGYMTDVEGNFDYFERYVSLSSVLFTSPNGELKLHGDFEERASFVWMSGLGICR